jgi:hypothetical protein
MNGQTKTKLKLACAVKPFFKGSISPTFSALMESSFRKDYFFCLQWQQYLAKLCQNMALGAKAIA